MVNQEDRNKEKEEKKRIEKWLKVICLLLVVIIIILLLRSCCPCNKVDNPTPSSRPTFNTEVDPQAVNGEPVQTGQDKIQEELNKQVQASMLNMSMNPNPVFQNGQSKGNLLIYNDKEINKNPLVVEIYKYDTNELIYKSGAIPVGSRVDEGKLLVDLEKGDYPCYAVFNGINSETGELMQQGIVNSLTVTVLK